MDYITNILIVNILILFIFMVVMAGVTYLLQEFSSMDESRSLLCGLLLSVVVLLIAVVPPLVKESSEPNKTTVEAVFDNSTYLTDKTITVGSELNTKEQNRFCGYGTHKKTSTYDLVSLEQTDLGVIVCQYKSEDGIEKYPITEKYEIQIITDGSEPRLEKTETFDAFALVEEPPRFPHSFSSLVLWDYSVGEIIKIEEKPSETSFVLFVTEEMLSSMHRGNDS